MYRIEPDALNELIQSLRQQDYTVIGPTLRGAAIVLDEITSTSQLPIGKTDEQAPAQYRLKERGDDAMFAFSAGPHSWKRYLFPPVLKLFSSRNNGEGFQISEELPSSDRAEKYALLGVRACDLGAIQIQDKVFGGGTYQDPAYLRVRTRLSLSRSIAPMLAGRVSARPFGRAHAPASDSIWRSAKCWTVNTISSWRLVPSVERV